MQIAVGQCPHICVGFPRPGIEADGLSKDVILPCAMERGLLDCRANDQSKPVGLLGFTESVLKSCLTQQEDC